VEKNQTQTLLETGFQVLSAKISLMLEAVRMSET
jgi:hypothetical protein